jgi:hypothetical protein
MRTDVRPFASSASQSLILTRSSLSLARDLDTQGEDDGVCRLDGDPCCPGWGHFEACIIVSLLLFDVLG